MNKRIQELAIRAGDDWDHTLESDKEFLKKFAELIVQECVFISRTSTDGFSAGRQMAEHFGVKE